MTYISNTETDRKEMLAAIGITSFEELLAPIPESIRYRQLLDLPPALDEYSLVRHMSRLASLNTDLDANLCFLGAGIYDHFRPSVVGAMMSRGEFATAYTPYQPEMSQGMLQTIYEYQTMICGLTGMDISNASMYDAATGLAEAGLMATSILDRPQIVVSRAVHPHYRQVIKTYCDSTGYEFLETMFNQSGSDIDEIKAIASDRTACVIFQHPDFLGYLEDVEGYVSAAHAVGAFAIASVDPISLGLLKPPGEFDVDIVVGEGQSLGNPMGFGGPLLGFFAFKKKFVRAFPGRIVGATVDQQGRRGYTMTLRTREQDIRREKATSNICTNQALIALCATVYMSEMGKSGFRHVADLCLQKAHYCREELVKLPGVTVAVNNRPFFKEFVVNLPIAPEELNRRLLKHGIVGGLPLGQYYAEMPNGMLICVTETKSREDIDRFVHAVAIEIAH